MAKRCVVPRFDRPWGLPVEEGWIVVAVLVIGIVAALLVALSLGFALLVELRALRRVFAHANTTRHRVFKVESGRHRKSEQVRGARAGVRADYEARILSYARSSVDTLESIRALLAKVAAPERVAAERLPMIGSERDDEADRLTSKLPEAPGAVAAYIDLATEARAVVASTQPEEELTHVWTAPEAPRGRREAAAGGATHHPSATPRAALSVAVAPPASAPPSTSPEPALLAAGLTRPKSARLAPHAPQSRLRTETLAGMPAPEPEAVAGDTSERASWPSLKGGGVGLSTHAPAGSAPAVAVPRFPATLVSMKAQGATPGSSAVPLIMDAPPRAPLAHADLIGSEDIADEAARPRLGPEDKTPPRRGRAAVLVPAFRGPEEGGAA
jgi:hypothetical protein